MAARAPRPALFMAAVPGLNVMAFANPTICRGEVTAPVKVSDVRPKDKEKKDIRLIIFAPRRCGILALQFLEMPRIISVANCGGARTCRKQAGAAAHESQLPIVP